MPCGDYPEYNERLTNSYTVNQPATQGVAQTLQVCPNCGHCPTCGRGGYQAHSWLYWYPTYPYYPYTNPWQPYWNINGTNTIPITSGSSANTGSYRVG